MRNKNAVTKEYMQNDRRFADAFNYFMYGGRQQIKPEDLKVQDTTELISSYGTDNKILAAEKMRDILKRAVLKRDEKAYYLLLGIENQSEIHYAMPVRNMLYDALNYASQVSEASARHKDKKDHVSRAEFLSGFHKEDRLTPLVTLVIYWEDGDWDAPTSLHEMYGVQDPSILKYVPDYKINLIVPDQIKDFSRFHTELGDVLRVFSVMEDKKKIQEMLAKHSETYSAVDEDSAKVLQECARIRLIRNEETGGYDMCKGFEDMRQEGIDIGVDKLAGLIKWLKGQNRINEALEVAEDAVLREKLFIEKSQSETNIFQN